MNKQVYFQTESEWLLEWILKDRIFSYWSPHYRIVVQGEVPQEWTSEIEAFREYTLFWDNFLPTFFVANFWTSIEKKILRDNYFYIFLRVRKQAPRGREKVHFSLEKRPTE